MRRGLAGWAARVARRMLGTVAMAPAVASTVSETTPFVAREESGTEPRLNLLLPSINTEHYFGGIHTAVSLYREMLGAFPRSRIILTDSPPNATALDRFSDHAITSAEQESAKARQLVPFSDRYGRTLPVQAGDCWLATAWWTAYSAQRLATWQDKHFGKAGRLAYLIQDFEPGFYPWSSQSAIALGTYRPGTDIGIFNTKLLADYFSLNGLDFARQHVFEPTLNEGLREARRQVAAMDQARARRIVVYARPSTPRNAFALLCEGLREWGWTDPASGGWEVVAPGELTADLDLGPFTLRAVGKLGLQDYAKLLSTSAVGVSLMVSPHPSYPPLEMAAFGMGVVTNRFANKDLGGFAPTIRSMDAFTPEALAKCIKNECAAWEARGMQPAYEMAADHPFLQGSPLVGIASDVARQLAQ